MSPTIFRVFLFLAVAVLAGCGRSPDTSTQAGVTRPSESGLLDEAKVIAIARQAVATNDTWVAQAEFETPRRDGAGWTVFVWRVPRELGGHRVVLIDQAGIVTSYIRGK